MEVLGLVRASLVPLAVARGMGPSIAIGEVGAGGLASGEAVELAASARGVAASPEQDDNPEGVFFQAGVPLNPLLFLNTRFIIDS